MYIAMTNYSDSRSATIYVGDSLEEALDAIKADGSYDWRIEKWINKVKVWEFLK